MVYERYMSTIENVSYKDVLEGNHSPADILIQIVDPGCDFPRPYYSFNEVYQLNFFDETGENVLEDSQALLLINILKGGLLNNKNIIVHCHAGICRSGAVVEVALMMGYELGRGARFRIPNVDVKLKLIAHL